MHYKVIRVYYLPPTVFGKVPDLKSISAIVCYMSNSLLLAFVESVLSSKMEVMITSVGGH